MTDWLTSSQTNGTPKSVYNTAMIYENALKKYLECLEKIPTSVDVERDRAKGLANRSFLANDIEFLLPMIAAKRFAVRQIPDLAVID